MLKSFSKGCLAQFKKVIARCWIAPLDDLLWEMVGFEQSSPQHVLRTAATWIKDLGRLIYTGFRVNVTRWDGPEWSAVYISDDTADSEKEVQYLLFSGAPTETKLGQAFLWQLRPLIQRFVSQGYLVVCDVNRLVQWRFRDMYCVRVFPWLRSLVDVSVPIDAVVRRMSRLRRRDLSKAQRLALEYGVSHELADLEVFYHEMYVPYISKRYHERAIIHSYEGQREVFEKRGQLLCVKHQDNLVAAVLGTPRRYGRTFSALLLGVHQDFTHLVKQGVATALYWHIMNWAHSNQLFVVDFGRVRARLNDGLFSFKCQLGMWFERDITTHTMWTYIGKNLPLSLIRHLNELALIAEVGKEYRCIVFDNDGASLPHKELTRREKIVAQAGLDGLLVL
jgi:hypothetical protein